jgi:prolipoprotein diacylglyceryltransferase
LDRSHAASSRVVKYGMKTKESINDKFSIFIVFMIIGLKIYKKETEESTDSEYATRSYPIFKIFKGALSS